MGVNLIGTPLVGKKDITHSVRTLTLSYTHPGGDFTGIWFVTEINTANTNEHPLPVVSVTIDGTPMTFSADKRGPNPPVWGTIGSYNAAEAWYSLHKPAGTYSIVVTYADPDTVPPYTFFTSVIGCVFSVDNMNQSTVRRGVFTNAGGHLSVPNQTVAFADVTDSANGDLVLIVKSGRVFAPHVMDPSQTSIHLDTQGFGGGIVEGGASFLPGTTGSTVHLQYTGGTGTDSEWLTLAFAIVFRPTQVATPPAATTLGADITDRVVGWNSIEQIKDILLGNTQLFTAEHTLTLRNDDGAFDALGPQSLVRGINWYNNTVNISVDPHKVVIAGEQAGLAYQGFIRNIIPNEVDRTVNLVSENVFKKAAETTFTGSGTAVNPATAMIQALRTVLDDDMIDVMSFHAAGGPARKANATVNYNLADGGNETVMSFIQKVSELSSISVWVRFNRMYARAFVKYPGAGAQLRYRLDDTIVREWGEWEWDDSAFNNRVRVGYPTGNYVTRNDRRSQQITGITRTFDGFSDTASVVATDEVSAIFFSGQYLERAGYRRGKLNVAAGPEARNALLGDRHPVYKPERGWNDLPIEITEVRPKMDTNEVELFLVQLKEPES